MANRAKQDNPCFSQEVTRPAGNLTNRFPVIIYCLLAFSLTWGSKLLYALVKARFGMPAFNFGLVASCS